MLARCLPGLDRLIQPGCGCGQDAQAKANAGYSLHQLQGDKAHGSERSGLLYKKSEG